MSLLLPFLNTWRETVSFPPCPPDVSFLSTPGERTVDDVLVLHLFLPNIFLIFGWKLLASRPVRQMSLYSTYLVEVDDVLMLHLCEDVDLLLYVLHGDAAPAAVQPFLLDVLGRVLRSTKKKKTCHPPP